MAKLRSHRESSSYDPSIRGGHFAKKQLLSRDWLISWSHRRRFEIGLELASRFAGKPILDYGCGDGTFLGMLASGEHSPSEAVGVEVSPSVLDDCRKRFKDLSNLRFELSAALDDPGNHGRFAAAFCMEVLEHVVDPEPLLRKLRRVLHPQGSLLISVPVERGVPLLVKQAVRRVNGWRGVGDYPGQTPYTWVELVSAVFGVPGTAIPRSRHRGPDGSWAYDHKGFDCRVLRRMIERQFSIESTISSPLSWLPPSLASQVWFEARPIRE